MEKYFFTFIVFHDKTEKLDATLESICQGLKRKAIPAQIVLVDEAGGAREAARRAGQEGVRTDYLEVTEENRDRILEQALGMAVGEYVNITKSGVLYEGDYLSRIYRYAEKKKEGKILVPAVSGKNSAVMKEVYAFRKEWKKSGGKTDLDRNYHIVHCNYFTYFIRRESFSDRNCADPSWTLSVLKKIFYTVTADPKLGLVKDAKLRIAARDEATAPWEAMLGGGCLELCRSLIGPLLAFCREESPACVKNAKYNLMYYCSRVINNYAPGEDPDEAREIQEAIEAAAEYIKDDEVLLFNQYLSREYKYFLEKKLRWENRENPEVEARRKDILDGARLDTVYQFIRIEPGKLQIECRAAMFGQKEFKVFFEVNGRRVEGKLNEREDLTEWFGEVFCTKRYASCSIPLEGAEELRIQVVCAAGGEEIRQKAYRFGKFTPLVNGMDMFYQKHGWLIFFDAEAGELVAAPAGKGRAMKLRCRRLLSLLKTENASRKAILARAAYGVLAHFKKKEIWLFLDRPNRGDDNGEVFFRYVCGQDLPNVKPYFIIAKDAPDYQRMQEYGEVVPLYSWKHKFLFLLSDYTASSQANKPVVNPFGAAGNYYRDIIFEKRLVFLQHGVTKDDQSAWLNRYSRNLYGFVVNTLPEYDSILDYGYYYTPKEVWLTMMPRYDALVHDEKRYVTIMPTWRKTLSAGTDASGVWLVGDDFVESDYFKFYDRLLNHEKLLAAAKKYGYTVCFMPHPNIEPAIGLFHRHPDVVFWDSTKAYREVFAESDLLVTDYSSVVFDFAYLRKPIVYCQFDREEFFSGGHSYVEGYFNYQEDGFGEVEEDLEGLVARVIEYMEGGCRLKEKYARRIEETFAYNDRGSCRRVLDKMLGKTISEERERR